MGPMWLGLTEPATTGEVDEDNKEMGSANLAPL